MASLDETIKMTRATINAAVTMLRYMKCDRTATALLDAPIEELIGLAESAEYYMNLADQRGKQIDGMRTGLDTAVPVPEQIATRCTYLMTQEDLDD